jgi:site-specific recombinase XerD
MSAAEEAARMPKRTKKQVAREIVLRLPDLDHAKTSVLNSLSSPRSRRNYKFAMEQFITWYCSEPRFALNRTAVLRFRLHLESLGLATGTINQRLAAVRRLAYEAADSGLLSLATNLKELGVEDTTIQRILRHEDVRTTQRFYIKTAPKVAQGAMRVLEEKIGCTPLAGQLICK